MMDLVHESLTRKKCALFFVKFVQTSQPPPQTHPASSPEQTWHPHIFNVVKMLCNNNVSSVKHQQSFAAALIYTSPLLLITYSKALLLCRVVLGRILPCTSAHTLRKPPDGHESVGTSDHVPGSGDTIFAVYDNSQAIPEYIVHLV